MWAIKAKHAPPGADSDNITFLGRDADFKGVVNFDGTVHVDGHLEGEVHTTGTLIVGENAVVKGIISAGTLMTSGKIDGTITVSEKVQVLKHSILIGTIRTPAISIEDGAHFHGTCDMSTHKWLVEQSLSNQNVHNLTSHQGKVRSSDL